ncbi:hypothetical protein RRSWK_05199 [Rhodopirellula sp. SWK7]|nr:hypothetical protein RRSWK_05199 [Rhodopirellula sp. SWK7]
MRLRNGDADVGAAVASSPSGERHCVSMQWVRHRSAERLACSQVRWNAPVQRG